MAVLKCSRFWKPQAICSIVWILSSALRTRRWSPDARSRSSRGDAALEHGGDVDDRFEV